MKNRVVHIVIITLFLHRSLDNATLILVSQVWWKQLCFNNHLPNDLSNFTHNSNVYPSLSLFLVKNQLQNHHNAHYKTRSCG